MRVILPRRFRARDVPVVIAREVSAEHSRIHLDVPLGQSRFRSCKPAKNSHAGLHHEVGISIQRSRRLVCPRRDPDLIALHRHGQARLQTRERIHPTLPIVRPARTLPHIDDPHVILRGIQIGNLRRTQGAVVDTDIVQFSAECLNLGSRAPVDKLPYGEVAPTIIHCFRQTASHRLRCIEDTIPVNAKNISIVARHY